MKLPDWIQRAVDASFDRSPNAANQGEMPQLPPGSVSVMRPMPRRKIVHTMAGAAVTLPRARRVTFKAGLVRTVQRLLVWISGALKFLLGNALDVVLRRDSLQRRAVRLRRIFERGGGTFTKLGQQLSVRADLLPYDYCVELSKLLDQVPPFATQEAVATIERNYGRSLDDVFAVFDPQPIGSASLACVYQAELKTGERVAVKIRRPGIGQTIAADLRAMGWILNTAETLTYFQPGLTGRFREELQTILFGELNFRTEARYTDMFRRNARKHNDDVTAPQINFEYCTEEILVGELVSGVWMWELMAAVDGDDREFLNKLRGMGIEPKSLARKLHQIMQREVQEELFFHADPHPANLVVLPNNRICFIDFGAIGRFSTQSRMIWREIMYHMVHGDIGRMVNCSVNLSGPLPPVDVYRVGKEMEKIYADWVYAQKSKDAKWWERSTAQAWLQYIQVARKYGISVTLETIQFFRATVLYDSIITRLDRDIDFTKEYKVYARIAGKEARKRVQKSIRARLGGPTDQDYLYLEKLGDSITQLLFNLQRAAENQTIHFRSIVGKISYVASLILQLGYLAAIAMGAGLLLDTVSRRLLGYEIDWPSILQEASSFGWVQLTLLLAVLVLIRRVMLRLNMPDSRPDPDR
jgi:predicted unusual protein kinase regulating ubiquinone biosynthesis (AarF/ABC1/UbiB family)